MLRATILLLTFVLSFASASPGFAYSCGPFGGTTYPGTIIGSQSGIDGFPSGCTLHRGRLLIGGRDRDCPNSYISSLHTTRNLTRNTGILYLQCLRQLTSADDLAKLTDIGGGLFVGYTLKLSNIDGLANVTQISESTEAGAPPPFIAIKENVSLTNLDGLTGITQLRGDLTIRDNPALTDCSGVETILRYKTTSADSAGTIDIQNNGPGCNSVADIIGNPAVEYTVTPSTGFNGSISPATTQTIVSGATASFTLTPNTGYEIAGVGGTCGGTLSGSTYTTASITSDCNVVASFSEVDSPEAFVERHYVNALGRPSDPPGLASWVNLMYSQSAATVPIGFLTSAEYINRGAPIGDFVNTLYLTFFNRRPNDEEFRTWADQLLQGRLREMVIWDVVKGAEFKQLSDRFGVLALSAADEAAYGIRAFTERFYTVVLVRYPDPAGFHGWVNFLTDGTYSGSDLARGFFLSPEYVSQNKSDSLFLDDCYQAYFDRAADPAGKQGWLDLMAQGMSREEVLNGFSGSQEFIKLAESYGIRPFAVDGEDGSFGAEAIPTLPVAIMLLLTGLLGLFGFRKLRAV